LLGADTVLVHAKDLLPSAEAGSTTVAAGRGALDYAHYLSLLQNVGFDGPLILHSLAEEEVPGSVAFLRAQINQLAAPSMGTPNAVLQSRQP